MLVWHGRLWLIDHGAALYFHHARAPSPGHAQRPFEAIAEHVLLPVAGSIADADERLAPRATAAVLEDVAGAVPAEWLGGDDPPACTSSTWASGSRRRGSSWRRRSGLVGGGSPFSYAVIRIVPRVERGERINAGVIVFCRPLRYLGARTALDERRLAALAPSSTRTPCAPTSRRSSGSPPGKRAPARSRSSTQTARFHWLVSPSSTIIQPSAVHTGLCDDPREELEKLFAALVV